MESLTKFKSNVFFFILFVLCTKTRGEQDLVNFFDK